MPYKYLDINPNLGVTTGCLILNQFQAYVDVEFYNSPDAFIIQEEATIGMLDFQNVDVRVNRGINTYTGEKLGDDWKNIIFKDLAHSTSVGYKYYFDQNYWIVTNSEIIKNFAASCIVRRCNNVLRWVDSNGNYYEEPCAIDYKIARPKDTLGAVDPVQPNGYFDVYCQSNVRTRTIKGNQRFLFGATNNRVAFKIFGDGVRNFLNQETFDDDSSAILVFTIGGNYVNSETDDIQNGIADSKKIVYSFSMTPSYISGSVTNTFQLIPEVTYQGIAVSVPISFTSSASPIASVSGSGLVTLNSNGSAVITSYMTKNISASAICNVIVSASPISYNEIRILPEPNYILEGDSQNYDFSLYNNGQFISGSFTFITSGCLVPSGHYTMTTSASSLSINNIEKFVDYPITIDVSSGSGSGSAVRQIEIYLRGVW